MHPQNHPDTSMSYLKWLMPLLVALLATGCSNPPRHTAPAPAPPPVEPRPAAEPKGAEVQAYRPPQQVVLARPQPARAVQVLMDRADDQRRAGDPAAAAASLERALRIEPRNARLWNRLAHVRMQLSEFDRVEQFAAKSNALAGSDDGLRADNWQLIADSRAARGDKRGAAQARSPARVFR